MRSSGYAKHAKTISFLATLLLCRGAEAQDDFGRLPRDTGKPVPTKADLAKAWQKRQEAIETLRFVWTEQQTHPHGWIPNPRFPQREWLAIPGLLSDRSYSVTKSLAVDGSKMRYSFELDRKEEPDGIVVPGPQGGSRGLGVRRAYSYLSVFDGRAGKARLSSLTESPPATLQQGAANVDAQNLDLRAILMAFRPLDPVMGHLLMDRAVPNQGRRIYNGRSTMILEERHDPSGWKTSLWVEPEREFLVNRYRVVFEQKVMIDIEIDYLEDAKWGWIPNAWRITEMVADGTSRLVAEAKVSRYAMNQPIGIDLFQ